RFAFVRTPVWEKADAEAQNAFAELTAALGSAVETVDLPANWAEAWEVHRTIMAVDMAHNLSAIVARGPVSNTLHKLLEHGRKISATHYLAALDQPPRYAAGLDDIFNAFDAFVT